MTVEEGLDREVYLVDPKLHDKLHEHMQAVTLYLAISRAKVLQLIPVRLPGSGRSWRELGEVSSARHGSRDGEMDKNRHG